MGFETSPGSEFFLSFLFLPYYPLPFNVVDATVRILPAFLLPLPCTRLPPNRHIAT